MKNIFKNVKLVLWDFDDTLCIHSSHGSESERFYLERILTEKVNAWNSHSKSTYMGVALNYLKSRGVKQGLISTVLAYKDAEYKCKWVKREYGIELENYCVSSFEGKLDMMFALKNVLGLSCDEILIVDDYYDNLERAANNGFLACTPMEVVEYIEKKGLSEYYGN